MTTKNKKFLCTTFGLSVGQENEVQTTNTKWCVVGLMFTKLFVHPFSYTSRLDPTVVFNMSGFDLGLGFFRWKQRLH